MQASKRWDALHRPNIHCAGVICAGVCEAYYLLDTDLAQDSNMQATLIAHSLDVFQEVLKCRGCAMPAHLHIQSDNTARETRNQWLFLFASTLVAKGAFRSVSIGFMMVGHTHIDIDQRCWGVRQARC